MLDDSTVAQQVIAADSACTFASARRLQTVKKHYCQGKARRVIMALAGGSQQAARPCSGAVGAAAEFQRYAAETSLRSNGVA